MMVFLKKMLAGSALSMLIALLLLAGNVFSQDSSRSVMDAINRTLNENPTPLLGQLNLKDADKKKLETVLEQCDSLLAGGESREAQIWLYNVKVKVLFTLIINETLTPAARVVEMEKCVTFLEDDPASKTIVKNAKLYVLKFYLRVLSFSKNGNGPDPYQLREKIKQYVVAYPTKESDQLTRQQLEVAKLFLKRDRKFVVETFREFGELYADSKIPQDAEFGRTLLGTARRYDLIGKPMLFSGLDITGKRITNLDYKGKVVLVEFWETTCIPCVKGIPKMKELYSLHKEKGFEIVGISVDQNKNTLMRFVEKEKLPWTIISDAAITEKGGERISDHYGVKSYPTLILIGKNGNVIATDFDPYSLQSELTRAFLNGSGPLPKPSEILPPANGLPDPGLGTVPSLPF